MRQIKFRGKRANNGEWLYGDLLQTNEGSVCIGVHGQYIDDGMHFNDMYNETPYIDEDSIGQFTGLTDCNGKEIYEGDILRYGGSITHVVEFKHGMFGYTLADGWFVGYGGNSNFTFNPLDKSKEHEVIGNVFDNPSLIPNQPTAI